MIFHERVDLALDSTKIYACTVKLEATYVVPDLFPVHASVHKRPPPFDLTCCSMSDSSFSAESRSSCESSQTVTVTHKQRLLAHRLKRGELRRDLLPEH